MTPCRVAFGSSSAQIRTIGSSPDLVVAVPVLAGPDMEEIFNGVDVDVRDFGDGCHVFNSRDRISGFAVAAPELDLEAAAQDLYRRLLAVTAGMKLYRICNYVPGINAVQNGLENYQRFCRGRSHAFEDHFGHTFQHQLPAASAVGSLHGPLAIAFVAGTDLPRHFENPRQVPAFEYPPAYGPRPPSFSRATLVANAAQRTLYVSGTAAIRGHATVAADDLGQQLACTRENLTVIAATAGAGGNFGAADGWQRKFKVFIRHDTDLRQVRNDLERHLFQSDDRVIYLQADLCRSALRVEIEAVLTKEGNPSSA